MYKFDFPFKDDESFLSLTPEECLEVLARNGGEYLLAMPGELFDTERFEWERHYYHCKYRDNSVEAFLRILPRYNEILKNIEDLAPFFKELRDEPGKASATLTPELYDFWCAYCEPIGAIISTGSDPDERIYRKVGALDARYGTRLEHTCAAFELRDHINRLLWLVDLKVPEIIMKTERFYLLVFLNLNMNGESYEVCDLPFIDNGSDTLCIHPDDPSTVMLEDVYSQKNWDLVHYPEQLTDEEFAELIRNHKRIIMLGHGTPDGLLRADHRGYVIDHRHVPLLRNKETASIWCYSDLFFKRNGLKGFHTGMIISEVAEEKMVLGYCPLNEREMYDNMIEFSCACADALDLPLDEACDYVLEHYNHDDPVTRYNRNNVRVL